MILTTDDLCPQHMGMFKETWDRLKEKHPYFKLIAFTTLKWKDGENELITENKDFQDFCNERKDWLILASHGFIHKSPEGLLPEFDFNDLMKKFADLETACKVLNAYKPPFYKWNYETLLRASNAGIRFFFVQDGFLDLKNFKFFDRTDVGLIDSHTNPLTEMSDRIDLIYKQLDEAMKNVTKEIV